MEKGELFDDGGALLGDGEVNREAERQWQHKEGTRHRSKRT